MSVRAAHSSICHILQESPNNNWMLCFGECGLLNCADKGRQLLLENVFSDRRGKLSVVLAGIVFVDSENKI